MDYAREKEGDLFNLLQTFFLGQAFPETMNLVFSMDGLEGCEVAALEFCKMLYLSTKNGKFQTFEFNVWGFFNLEIREKFLKISKGIKFTEKLELQLY